MSDEERSGVELRDRSAIGGVPTQHLSRYWTSLDRGWQAIFLSAVLVLAVGFGLPVPW